MLRDECNSLDDLIRKEDLDRDDFISYFREKGYEYDESTNSFKPKD